MTHLTLFQRCLAATGLAVALSAGAQAPSAGQTRGSAAVHDAASARAVIDGAQVGLPAAVAGSVYLGPWRSLPEAASRAMPVPTVVFLHGSSGLGLKAIGEWQRWLAEQGVASVAPDSFGLADRLVYGSPVDVATYERIHALRASEIALAVAALKGVPWADASRLLLAGTSEGAVAVARHDGAEFAGRLVFSWSCERNYFVDQPATALAGGRPVLNVMSLTDPYFSAANPWLGNPAPQGHCGSALAANPQAVIVLLPQAPHTLINLPAARAATLDFVRRVTAAAR